MYVLCALDCTTDNGDVFRDMSQYLCILLLTVLLRLSHCSTKLAISFLTLFFSASGVFAF